MPSPTLFSSLYNLFSHRRPTLYVVTLGTILASIIAFGNIRTNEDIRSMLPDTPPQIKENFQLLTMTPLARKVIVHLEGKPGASTSALTEAANHLAQAMGPPLFTKVVSGPNLTPDPRFFHWLLEILPNLVNEKEISKIRTFLTEENIRIRLKEIRNQILCHKAWEQEKMIRLDPLRLRFVILKKLRHLSPIPRARVIDNCFVSPQGQSALIIADTPVRITDSSGSKHLLTRLHELVEDSVPPRINVQVISGHRYAAANAQRVKKDLFIVLGCSLAMILLLFFHYLRSWRGIFVFFVPVSVLCISALGVSLIYDPVSAITIGFGAVLLGISVDFAVHVFFALRSTTHNPSTVVARVSRPVMSCGVTTLAAFGVLLFSNLPGQRQLGVFSMTGIAVSLIISLVVLPHLIRPEHGIAPPRTIKLARRSARQSRWVISLWIVVLALCIWQARHLKFNGDLKTVNYTPQEIQEAEEMLQDTWGNITARAVFFARGEDLQAALETNDRVYDLLSRRFSEAQITSLSPILPSMATQEHNRQLWKALWTNEKKESVRKILDKVGRSLGFSPRAFDPFFEELSTKPHPITPKSLRMAGLGYILDSLIVNTGDQVQVMTMVPDRPEVLEALFNKESWPKGARLVSRTRLTETINNALGQDFIDFILRASLAVLLLVGILFRNPRKVVYTLVPVITGLGFMFGVMGLFGIPFNLFNVVATVLVIGLGVDYGIFMVYKLTEGYDYATDQAVLVSGLTTLAGLGALILAEHPAMHSIGVSVILGIGAAIPSAIVIIPAIYTSGRNRPQEK